MAFAAARMILKDKRRKTSRDEYPSRNRSRGRSKDGHGYQSPGGTPGHKPHMKVAPSLKPSSNKIQAKGPPSSKSLNKKNKKGQRHQYDLMVTIDLGEHGLTEDQVSDFKEAFMLMDKDEDGVIDSSELALVLRFLGQRPSDGDLCRLVKEFSQFRKGSVEFNEFLQLMSKSLKESLNSPIELLEAFRVFDKNGRGWILATEFRNAMINMGDKMNESDVQALLKEADVRGDGRILYEEFVSLLVAK
ncbi:uncharacterized protein LOC136030000 isoform X2 [Artemia franciscana]|uniref:EF-hand domain-containing protein n=1 Tax=Artemia franciscana TaxID=6661 RepID=A0AA88KYF7_ARTSF|nr:hypothetical protein QYM36_016584 [Artemia franciscana]KAK2706604.1 hypothetical protein QYM36_016584 [Artemia franciscana]